MIQLPDIDPYLKGGVIGVLVFVIIGLIVVIGWLVKNNLAAGSKADASLRELRAGEKDPEFWQKDYDSRAAAQTRIVVEHLGKIRARLRDIDQKIDRFDTEVKAEFQQVRRDIATLARAIEMKDRE